MTRVLVVAADPLARAGLSGLLTEWSDYAIFDAAPEESSFIDALENERPDVVLWDLGPGVEASFPPDLPTFDLPAVALLPDETLVEDAWAAGARGLLLRSAEPKRIVQALAAVEGGLVVIGPDVVEHTLTLREPASTLEDLTPREEEVLELLAKGLPNKLIADRLAISENTVKFHVSSLFSKLGVHSRTEAVMRAARQGLLIL